MFTNRHSMPLGDKESATSGSRNGADGSSARQETCSSASGDVQVAVETLKRMEGERDIQNDGDLHADILTAANIIIDFLIDPFSPTFVNDRGVRKCLDAFSELVHPSFLSILFVYRETFHAAAARALDPNASISTVICWVDVILAHLSEASVKIACGMFHEALLSHDFKSLRRQSEDNHIRAAAQLPSKWQAVPGVMSSDRASPAAKRLVLRLMFAVYIMGPQLAGHDPWEGGGVQPADMIGILLGSVAQLQVKSTPTEPLPPKSREQERLNCSMIVSLFAVSHSIQQKSGVSSSFAPHSFASLLHLIQLVIDLEDNLSLNLISPHEVLDPAEIVLVKWGSTVPWCWSVWGDQRIANAEYISHLTATWLYHLNIPLFGPSPEENPDTWKTCLMAHMVAANSGILQILHHCVLSFCSLSRPNCFSESHVNILFKSCWAAVQLLDPRVMPDRTKMSSTLELCKCLCILFCLLGSTSGELNTKNLIIEALTLVGRDELRLGITSVQAAANVRFTIRLDEVIARCKGLIRVDVGHVGLEDGHLHEVKLLVDFLTVCWQRGSGGSLCGPTGSLFLASLVDYLSRENVDPLSLTVLCDSVLSALATLEAVRSDPSFSDTSKIWQDEMVWRLAINSKCSNLPVAAAFANYIISAPHVCDALYCAEAWDHLRDVLLLILSHHFFGESEALALAICPSICHALVRLLRLMGLRAVQFIILSPWTVNLCAELKTALGERDANLQFNEYFTILKQRLEVTGTVLLNEIKHKLDRDSAARPSLSLQETEEFDSCLMYCHFHPIPRLIRCLTSSLTTQV